MLPGHRLTQACVCVQKAQGKSTPELRARLVRYADIESHRVRDRGYKDGSERIVVMLLLEK